MGGESDTKEQGGGGGGVGTPMDTHEHLNQ